MIWKTVHTEFDFYKAMSLTASYNASHIRIDYLPNDPMEEEIKGTISINLKYEEKPMDTEQSKKRAKGNKNS